MAIEIGGLADITRRHAAQRPDAAAIVHAGRVTSYAALDKAASRVANALIAEGIRPQVRVAHLDKSSDLFFELLFGIAKANAVIVSVNWRLAPPEVLHIVNDSAAEILFVGEEFFPVIEKIHHLGARTPGRIQAAEVGRLHRRPAAQSDRQDPEAGAPQALLGRPPAPGQLITLSR